VTVKLLFILNDHDLKSPGVRGTIRNIVATEMCSIGTELVEKLVVCSIAIWVAEDFDAGKSAATGFVRRRTVFSLGNFTGRTPIAALDEFGGDWWH